MWIADYALFMAGVASASLGAREKSIALCVVLGAAMAAWGFPAETCFLPINGALIAMWLLKKQ